MISRIIIIPAADQDAANQAALQFDPVGGLLTFTSPLASAGGDSPTHYWCAGPITPDQCAAFAAAIPGATVEEWDIDADPDLPDQLLTLHGLERYMTDPE